MLKAVGSGYPDGLRRRISMRTLIRLFAYSAIALALAGTLAVSNGRAQLKSGMAAPLFTLKDTQGRSYELAAMKEQPMVVVYFFDPDSRSSQAGLLDLDQLMKKYKEADLTVWGVTRSSKNKVSAFLSGSKLGFPVLLDSGQVSDVYDARMILPTVCIIGPDLMLLDYFQGGGKTTRDMLVTLAERTLQNRHSELAKAISNEVVKQDPGNVRAKSVQGYAALKEGDLKAAEKTFYNLSREKGSGEIIGKEGLSRVYAKKGQPEKAMQLTEEVEAKSGQRSMAHLVKGDLLYSQKKTKEAASEYRRAAEKPNGDPAYRAVAFNQLGRIYALEGRYSQSRDMYDKAVALDPYLVEATSNKGMIFERQGEWDKALEAYRRAQTIDRNDPFAATLAENAKRMLLLKKDPDKRKQMDSRIEEYAHRYKAEATDHGATPEDSWTSHVMIMTMMAPAESGGLSTRDGFGRVLSIYLASRLNASGRVQVVEPVVVERVMSKLGLTPKDLTDPGKVIKLAKAFGARLVTKGTLFHLSDGTLLNLKLVDVDDAGAASTIEHQFASAVTLRKDLHWLNREILKTVMTQYPLRGYVVEVTGNQVLLNLGASQGVVSGALFDVVEVKPPMVFKGKTFQPEPAVMATVEVVRVDDDFAYAHIKDQRRPVRTEDKLQERISQITDDGQRVW